MEMNNRGFFEEHSRGNKWRCRDCGNTIWAFTVATGGLASVCTDCGYVMSYDGKNHVEAPSCEDCMSETELHRENEKHIWRCMSCHKEIKP